MLRSFEEYIQGLTEFSDDELRYRFEDRFHDETSPLVLSEKGSLRNRPIFLLRHVWDTVSMYHRLPVCKFCYVYRGHFVIHTDEGTPTELSEGDLCIVPPQVLQKFTINYNLPPSSKRDENVLFNILFPVHDSSRIFAPLLAADLPVSDYLNRMLFGKDCPKFMILHKGVSDTLLTAQKLFYEIDRANDDEIKDKNKSLVAAELLLNLLLITYSRADAPYYSYSVSLIGQTTPAAQIMDYIHIHFSGVTLDELCERFHYTPSHICKLIRRHTGLSFKENLTNERMDFVCKHLTLTEKSINEIIFESGYSTKEYFYRAFKKHCGMTPGEYRKKYSRVRTR